ncbi:hypothetical protein ACXWTF_06325 [Thiomicrolovo sp. ZZH C-3]
MSQIKTIRALFNNLEKLIFSSDGEFLRSDSNIHNLIKELRGTKKYISDLQAELSLEFSKSYGEKAHVLDYIIFLHLELFLILSEKFMLDKNSEKNLDINDETKIKLRFTSLMMVHLINSLLSIRILLEKGLDVQAKQIFRSYIEYSDLSLAVLGNDEFYSSYRQMGDSEEKEREVWHKLTKPKSLTKILKKIYQDIDSSLKLWESIQNIRDPIYNRLSDYTHGHFMAVFFGATDKKVDGGVAPNALGAITKDMDYTLKHSILYSYSFIKHAMIAIVMYQKLPFMQFEEEGKRFVIHYKMLEIYMSSFLQSWDKD